MEATASEGKPASARLQRIPVEEKVLEEIENLYNQGLYADAHTLALATGPLAAWSGSRARVLAARLASRLEGDRFSDWLSLTAWRADRKGALTNLYRGYGLWRKEGPLVVWAATENFRSFEGIDADLEADFLALRARIAGSYRDFELAWRLMDEALRLLDGSPWLWSEKASLLLMEDRPDESTEASRHALGLQPFFRPAVQQLAVSLHRLHKMEEAMAVLENARSAIQSPEVVSHLISLRRELDDHAGMEALLDDYERRALLLEKEGREWLAARRCDLLCLRRDWNAAAEHAEKAGGEYYTGLAKRLRENPPAPKRVRLIPPKIIQRHNTCGPSSLAMIAGYWNHEATHDTIEDAICYDGTHDHSERQWCIDNGMVAREFTLTWESAIHLLDAGFPIALATVEVTSAHLQVLTGYDSARETFLIQDPGSYLYRETIATEFLKEYALYGPRALVFAPPEKEAELMAMDLPDSGIYDQFFAFNRALHQHKRDEADAILEKTKSMASGHRLLHQMEWSLAAYDDDDAAILRASEALASTFPDDPRLTRRRSSWILAREGRQAYLDFLRAQARSKNGHPVFWYDLATELAGDARASAEHWKCLRKAHGSLPYNQGVVEAWGDHWWQNGNRERAVDAYGFASSWAPTDERLAREWYRAEYLLGRRESALERLRARYRKLGKKSPNPGRTLFWILDEQNHDDEAVQVLEETLATHPEEGQLHLDAARFRSWQGDDAAALAHLAAAEKRVPRGSWLRGRAAREEHVSDHAAALATWRQILEREPKAYDAHAAVARLLFVQEGEVSARAHLDEAVARFPHNSALHRLRVDWFRDAPGDLPERAMRDLLKAQPDMAWAWRELAFALHITNPEEALAAARTALELAPREAASFGALAIVHETAGRLEEARRCYQDSLRLSVDYIYGMNGWMRTAADASERIESLRFIHAEMLRQVVSGECVSAYREHAFPLLDAPELLEQLRQIHRERPDLYVAWSQICLHLLDMGEGKQALQFAEDATRRFARLPGAWLGAARTRRALGDHKGAAKLARTANELNPHWDEAWIRRADYIEDSGNSGHALAVLEEARKRLPASGRVIAFLASMRWRLGDRGRAFEDMMAAARLMQGDSGVWEDAVDWARTLGREDEVIEAARALTRERPGDPDSWMLLARLLPDSGISEKLAVLDRAIALKPRLTDAWDQKARVLALKGRYKEAREACHPSCFNGETPYTLLGREAWICSREGSRTEAMEAMEKILEKHPDYHWGWICLEDWASGAKDKERTLRAQAALQRLSPRDVRTLCEIGDHLLDEGKETDALAKYEEAMLLSPGATYPLNQWLRLRWSRREVDRILAIRETVLPGASRIIADAYVVLAHLHKSNKVEAERTLAAIARSPERVGSVVFDLADAMARIGHARLWRKTLAKAARDGEIGMSFAAGWVAAEIESARYDAWKQFDRWIARAHDDAEEPISRYFGLLGDKHKMRKARGFFKTEAVKWVKARTLPYGNVGYALANARWWDMAVVWLEGAEKRDDAVGWLCTNLMLAHLERREFTDAFSVAHHVVERDLRDHTWACTVALSALGKAMDGDTMGAKETLSMVKGPDNNPTWKWIWMLAEELAAVLALEPSSREAKKRHAVAAKRLSSHARESLPGMSHGFLRLWFSVQARMSRHSGRPAIFDRWRMSLRAWLPF